MKKNKILKGGGFMYKMYWKGDHVEQIGVKLMVKKVLANGVVEMIQWSPRV